MIKTLKKVDRDRMYHNIIKAIYDKPSAIFIFGGKRAENFSFTVRIRQGCPPLPLLFNTVLEVLGRGIRQEKENEKRHPNWKGSSKTISVHRLHDPMYKKSKRIHKKVPRVNK